MDNSSEKKRGTTVGFNIAGHPEIGEKTDELIDRLIAGGAKGKTEAFGQLLTIAEASLEASQIRNAGGDIDGLEAALDSIRRKFRTLADSRQEVAASRDAAIADAKQKAEARAEKAEAEKEELRAIAEKASLESANAVLQMEQAQAAADSAKKQADSTQALADAKDDKIASLREQLEAANEKLKGYDALKEERDNLTRQLTEAWNEAEKAALTAQLKAQQEQEQLKSRIASLEAEVRILREFKGTLEPQ